MPLVNTNLVPYIEENLRAGYSASAIQTVLLNQGYPAQEVIDTIGYVQNNQRSDSQKKSTNKSKKGLLVIMAFLVVVGIGVSTFFLLAGSSGVISEEELTQGTMIQLAYEAQTQFSIAEQVHTLRVDEVTDDRVRITIMSDPLSADISVGEEKKFDVTGDDFLDVLVRLESISDGVPDLYVQRISERVCTEDWSCGAWGECSSEGEQSRSCSDGNACGTELAKPSTTQSCTYVEPCTEDWSCGAWGECSSEGEQSRSCSDGNACGTELAKPFTTQSCTFVEGVSVDPTNVELDIILPKTDYEVGEEISGEYYVAYQGDSFRGTVIYCTDDSCSRTTGMLEDIDFSSSDKTNNLQFALKHAFYAQGTYDFSIHVFTCEDIDEVFDTDDCGRGGIPPTIEVKDIISSVSSLQSKTKTVTVANVAEEYTPECTSNDVCTQTCTNCEQGTYVCAQSNNPLVHETCVECVSSFGCVDGYTCQDNVCVVEQQEQEVDEELESYPVTNPETILDCYDDEFSELLCSPEDSAAFTELFETRLVACESSQGTFAVGFEPFMGLLRGYEIQEEDDGVCAIRFWFLEHPVVDESFVGKDMVCEYDSSQRNLDEVATCFDDCCTGELVDVINDL